MVIKLRLYQARRWLPFLLMAILAAALSLLYIKRTFVNTVYLDGFFLVPLVGSFLNGSLSPAGLFACYGEHLLAGYSLITLFNARFLALDTRLDPVLFVIAYAATAAIIYAECSRVFSDARSIVLCILFIPLGFLCFSLVAPPLIFMSTQFVLGSAVALMIAWLVQYDINTSASGSPGPRWPIVGALVLMPVYIFIFSGAYFPGLLAGLGAMYVFHAASSGKWVDRRLMPVAAEAIVCVLIYVFYVFVLSSGTLQGGAPQSIAHYLTNPAGAVMFYLSGIGSGLMDQHTLESAPSAVLLLGGAMAAISVVALWLFIRTGMYRKTCLPVYCMFYTLGVITSVMVGRGMLGDYTWIANEWYSFHLRFFTIGVAWILVYVLAGEIRRFRRGAHDGV